VGSAFLLDSGFACYSDSQQCPCLDLSGLLMTLAYILVCIAIAVVVGITMRNRSRTSVLLVISAIAIYAFQPALPIRDLDFWLPTATLVITVLGWVFTAPDELRTWRNNWQGVAILGGIVLILGLTRLIPFTLLLTASRPPQIIQILLVLVFISGLLLLLMHFQSHSKLLLNSATISLIILFIVLKVPDLTGWVSKLLRGWNGQSTVLASPLDIRWLGFSYIAFRILHTLRDRMNKRLPPVNLSEYVVYVIFFPSLSAGPIDRIERFVTDLRHPFSLSLEDGGEAGKRIILGLFKKFVVADALSLVALNPTNSTQVHSSGWAWVLLYAYAFQIYFDFSGYTDIAIGLARLVGIRLPENFKAPYLKANITQFWNNWHMTLTQWFRAYFFNPLTRALRSKRSSFSPTLVIFISQISTMVLIGLWHGVTSNFILWGLWHGVGLIVHNRWSELTKTRFNSLPLRSQKILNAGGVFLTFHYIAIGWVFFALPTIVVSGNFIMTLFSIR
jgi:alginate O-acetyltransferase complex protein AlgI